MGNTFNLGNGNWAQKTEKLLAYNAENDNYKPLPFDFDRASTATRVNKQGLIETVGVDEPRIDFLNNTKGHLLLEPSRSNLLTYSDNGSSYTVFSATKTLNEVISLDGTLNSFTLEGNGDYNQVLGETGFVTLPSAGDYAFSVFAKKGNNNFIQLFFNGFSGSSNGEAYFDLQNGTTPTSGASIENYGNGWYRCSFVGTVVSGDLYGRFGFRISYTSSNFFFPTANDANGKKVYFYGFQVEAGSYATSYIPTSGQSGGVTRSADSCSQTVPDGVIGQTEGTILVDFNFDGDISGNRSVAVLSSGGSADFIASFIFNNLFYARIRANNGSSFDVTKSNLTSGNHKIAIAYASNDLTFYLDGNIVGQNTSASVSFGSELSTIKIGEGTSGTAELGGLVSKTSLYNTRLSNSELAALTQV